jgi:toxin ParE1/3/4
LKLISFISRSSASRSPKLELGRRNLFGKQPAAIAALETIERMPAMGSPRLGQLCELPGLRSWRVTGFPMQWLYFEADRHLDVVRLLGDRQDIVAILSVDE